MTTVVSIPPTEGMKQGYNENSLTQMAAVQLSAPSIRQAIDVLDIEMTPLVIIADFGCSHGSNSMYAMQFIIQTMNECNKIDQNKQQILVAHNDLPTNNWSSLFEVLNQNNSYYGVASGRSFYDQCLPSNSLVIGYSSMSMHWLSCKPCNLSNECLVDYTQNDNETNAFKKQAALDYARFLEHRSNELIPGGVLILGIITDNTGQDTREHARILYQCAQALLSHEELLGYTIPIYCRSYVECVDNELFAKYNLELIKADVVNVKSPLSQQLQDGSITLDDFARIETLAVRSALEYPLKQTLLNNKQRSTEEIEELLNQYWALHETEVKKQPNVFDSDLVVINLVLRKLKK